MKLTDGLLGEHAVFYAQFDHMEQVVPAAEGVAEIRTQSAMLTAALATHAGLEEELLFQSLDPYPEAGGPLNVMRAEHQEIENTLEQIPGIAELEIAQQRLLHVVYTARQHFAKEEQILFKLAGQLLGEEVLRDLGTQWALRRKVMVS
jgi:iron-sulfur cluster repair protein YtfE (RIC family)